MTVKVVLKVTATVNAIAKVMAKATMTVNEIVKVVVRSNIGRMKANLNQS